MVNQSRDKFSRARVVPPIFFFVFLFFFCFFFFFSLRSGDGFAVDGCRARESMMQPEEEVPLVSRRTPPVPGVVADRKMR